MARKHLYLFTASFPYGTKIETFLETEIKVLAEMFETVYVVPAQRDGESIRSLPSNVLVLPWLIEGRRHDGKLLVLKHGWRMFRVFLFMMRSNSTNRTQYIRHFQYYFGQMLGELDYYERLNSHLKGTDLRATSFYTYWFECSLLALCLLKRNGTIKQLVSRAHGFDLYDDRNQDRPIPFREYKLQQLDAVYCISGHGLKYLKDKVATTFHPKIQLSYLGVKTPVLLPKESQNQIPVLVSVSSLVDFKRVGLIAQALKHYESPLKWIHFGSGPLWNEIKSQVAALPNNIQVELKGHVENEDVLNFYSCNHVDMFISSSESEGLPVSMMEAQSFNIPILSCNVGGISEIVINEKTGILLPVKIEPEALATQIQNTLNLSFKKSEIQKHFELNFEATHNYRLFCKKILKIG